MAKELKTKEGWIHTLREPGRQLTLDEFVALCTADALSYQVQAFHASEHTEGMIGAIDFFLSQLAPRMGLPYAASSMIRAAMDAQRDEERRIADEYRKKAIAEAEEKPVEPS